MCKLFSPLRTSRALAYMWRMNYVYQEAQVNQTLLVFGVKYLLFSLPLLERNLYCVCYVWRVDLKKIKINVGGGRKETASNGCKSIKKRLLFLCKLHSRCSSTAFLASLKAMARKYWGLVGLIDFTALTETDRCAKLWFFFFSSSFLSLCFWESLPLTFHFLLSTSIHCVSFSMQIKISAIRCDVLKLKRLHNWMYITHALQNTRK